MELCLFVDHACNLRCRYCYNGEHFARAMPLETAKKALALALSRRPASLDVSFFGGEPLLHTAWLGEVVREAERRVAEMAEPRPRLRFVLNTNATLLGERALELFAPPRAFVAFVSLDGDAATHDRLRVDAEGCGSHEAVARGLSRLCDARVTFETVAVVGCDNASEVGRTVSALAAWEPRRVVLSPNWRDPWTDATLEALRGGLSEAADVVVQRFRADRPLLVEPLHTKILTHLFGGSPCPSRCQLGQGEFTCAPSGNLYPCAQMVGEDRDDVWVIGHVDRGFDAEKVARLMREKERVETTCAPCDLRDRCQSHCGCRHIALTGRLGEISALLCEVEAAFIAAADRIAETLWSERCPAFVRTYYERSWVPVPGSALYPLRTRA